ncbi:hypothetical protein ILUMI_06826 [Ignelater luminosus]|uniref:Uncharacterized protein n=1 Tax=Ignelater luminosus TaxID=2038154 RepID=A0A8K0DEQ4_IGNLU|nr:hypothetical protein ILUMI_06826 [Ignelater luminosus]
MEKSAEKHSIKLPRTISMARKQDDITVTDHELRTPRSRKEGYSHVYAPTADKSDEMVEIFYDDLTNTLKKLHKNDVTLVTGDFNVKIGQGRSGIALRLFGLNECNRRREHLRRFSIEEK